MNWISMA